MCPNKGKRPKCAPPKRHKFTKAECQRGYQAALAKCSEDWNLLAWFSYRVRGHYRKKRRDACA